MLNKVNKKRVFIFSSLVLAVVVITVAVVGSLLHPVPAQALIVPGQEGFERGISNSGYGKESFDFQTINGTIGSLNVLVIGCTSSAKNKCPEGVKTGAVQGVGNMIASIYSTPPASGGVYVASVLKNFGVTPAYAQTGTGFSALNPVLDLWRAFRNIAYMFFIFGFIAMGLAIMFRVKLSPQAVITIQSALPRLIVALLLITFSYAIAGFMIDLMYVFLLIFIQFLGAMGILATAEIPRYQETFLSGDILGVLGALVPNPAVIPNFISAFYSNGIAATIGAVIGAVIGSTFSIPGVFIGGLLGAAAGGVAATALITLLIVIAVLYSFVRIFLTLLISYITIIILVIFGPIQILLDAFPFAHQFGAGAWFKNLFANIAIFPIAAILITVGHVLTSRGGVGWAPYLLPNGTGEIAQSLVGLGMLLFTAQALNSIKSALKTVSLARETEAVAQKVGGAITWGPKVGAEEVLRREAYARGGTSVGRAIVGWGERLRRWRL